MVPKVRTPSRATTSGARFRAGRAKLLASLPIGLFFVGLVGMPILLVKSGGLGRLGELVRERDTVELEISRVSRRVKELEARAQAARDLPSAVERAARDQLGLVRKTEVVYQFQVTKPAKSL